MELKADFHESILRFYSRNSATRNEYFRLSIILNMHGHPVNIAKFTETVGCDRKTVRIWYYRIYAANAIWEYLVSNILREPGHAGINLRKQRLIQHIIGDKPRSGTPCKYTAEQYTQIVKLALLPPGEFGRPITHWTARELTDEIYLQNIVPGISCRQVKRFLDQADLKPHKSQYWLNPKIDDPEEHEKQVKEICDLYLQAIDLYELGIHLISVDEKTGIQALERINPTKPMRPGLNERIEAEYRRHGTQCLIPSFEVGTGKIIQTYVGDTRNENDFVQHIASTVAQDIEGKWIFILDQLNTHMSESLVRFVAGIIGYDKDLGEKDEYGILKNMATRRQFLTHSDHRIRFVYTPKHCSWLNQVEIWFGILARKVLKRGNFNSKEQLRQALLDFVDYFNKTMAKPFRWTYKGKPLTV